MEALILNPERISMLKGLVNEADPLFLETYLGDFLKNMKMRIPEIEDAVANHQPEALSAAAHALNSSCLNAGADRMSSFADQLERIGKRHKNLTNAQAIVVALKQAHEQVIREIQVQFPKVKI